MSLFYLEIDKKIKIIISHVKINYLQWKINILNL